MFFKCFHYIIVLWSHCVETPDLINVKADQCLHVLSHENTSCCYFKCAIVVMHNELELLMEEGFPILFCVHYINLLANALDKGMK